MSDATKSSISCLTPTLRRDFLDFMFSASQFSCTLCRPSLQRGMPLAFFNCAFQGILHPAIASAVADFSVLPEHRPPNRPWKIPLRYLRLVINQSKAIIGG